MAEVKVMRVIDVVAVDVWNAVRAIGGLDRWFPVIAKCRVEGQGVGAKRVCELANGMTLVERIEQIDDAAKVFTYSITESPLPIRNYLGAVQVRNARDGKTEVTWSARFDVGDAQRDEMIGMLYGAFTDGIQGLEKDLKARK